MNEDKESSKKESSKEKKLIVTASLSLRDAQRVQQAFDEGRLADLGITSISFSPSIEPLKDAAPEKKDWAKGERRKKQKPRDDGTPPLP